MRLVSYNADAQLSTQKPAQISIIYGAVVASSKPNLW